MGAVTDDWAHKKKWCYPRDRPPILMSNEALTPDLLDLVSDFVPRAPVYCASAVNARSRATAMSRSVAFSSR